MLALGSWNYPWHDYTVGVAANVVLFCIGYAASIGGRSPAPAAAQAGEVLDR